MCQIEVSFICSIGIFSDSETLELLTVSKTFFPVWPLLASVLFVELFHLYLFVTIANVADSLNYIPFFWVNVTPFSMCGLPCVTFTQCSFINYKPSYCFLSFHTLPLYCMDCHTFLPLFWVELSHSSLCECHTNALCVLSLITVWMSHLRVSIFFVWMSHEYPCVSITFKWTLHFVSF